MKNTTSIFTALFLVLSFIQAKAQDNFKVKFSNQIIVTKDGASLPLAWAGGLNSPQFSSFFANDDELPDLFVFDRASRQVQVYIQVQNDTGSSWEFAPEYTTAFPKLSHWALLRDFDQDGEKDLFTATTFGVIVYRNTKKDTGILGFEVAKDLLLTTGQAGSEINLNIDVTDIPVVMDLDDDGDMDILTFRPVGGNTIELQKNMSQEQFGNSDNLVFENTNIRWGNFEECFCNDYVFSNQSCRAAQVEHAGSSMLLLNLDENPSLDLLVGEISCGTVSALFNDSDSNVDATFSSIQNEFPILRPIDIPTFAGLFYEDIDFDGTPDLIAAPNLSSNDGNLVDFESQIWFYKNRGTTATPDFDFIREDFLQKDMIEVGENTSPLAIDADNDGDLDLILGERGHAFSGEIFKSRLHFLKNTGTNQNPEFDYVQNDLAGFSDLNLRFVKLTAADINGDERKDLAMVAYDIEERKTRIFWIENSGSSIAFDTENIKELDFEGINLSPNDEVLFTNLDNDEFIDALVLQSRGGIRSFLGTNGSTFELENNNYGNILGVERGSFSLYSNSNNLIISDPDEGVFLVRNFKSQEEGFNLIPLVINEEEQTTLDLGNTLFPSNIGDHLFFGTQAGGLISMIKDNDLILSLDAQDKQTVQSDIFKVFPNPSNEKLIFSTKQKGNLEVIDIQGRVVFSRAITSPETQIETSDWKSGLYIVRFLTSTGTLESRKIAVTH